MGEARPVRPQIVPVLKDTVSGFKRHKSQWLAAAIAYFTMFAIAPLLVIIIAFAGIVLGQHPGMQQQLYGYLSQSAGNSAAAGIQTIVTSTQSQHNSGGLAQYVSWGVFVLAAVGLFASLQEALNTVWDVEPGKQSILAMAAKRALSFLLIVAMVALLLASVAVNAAITVAAQSLANVFPFFSLIVKAVEFIVTFAIFTGLFALLFEFLPDCRVDRRDVRLGSAVTAFLFVIGQFLLGWYLGRAGISSTFGAFGGLVTFLVWVNYSAQILLFGAEFTHVYAQHRKPAAPKTSRDEIDTREAAPVARGSFQ
jgi:membrane protein